MRLLMLFGAQAVGKMTVGQALTRYLKLDNSALSPEDAAERIATHFGLARLQAPDEEGAPQA